MKTYIRNIKKYCEETSLTEDTEKFINKIEKDNAKMIKEDGNW